jgi:uncharacterized protein (DUF1697 family)
MNTYVALFRGINVGGANILPMRELVTELEGLGLSQIQTYIQSGNVVFQSNIAEPEELARTMRQAIHNSHGFEPKVIVLDLHEFEQAVEANPFPEAALEPKTLHFYFLARVPDSPDLDALQAVKKDSERYELLGKVLYLHAPDGIGRSKLVPRVEKALGVPATGRNWRTVSKLLAMSAEPA